MITKRLSSWFLSESGRKFVCLSVATVSGMSVFGQYVPQTFGVDYYIDIIHLYKSGIKQKVSRELLQRVNKCTEILKMNETSSKNVKPFMVFGYDLFHAGVQSSRFGISIGVPDNFKYKSQNDIEKDSIQVNMQPIDWTSEHGEMLGNALILPEKVQIFGICREILMAQTPKFFIDTAAPSIILLLCYGTAKHINESMRFHSRPAGIRYMMYSLVSIFGVGLYFLSKDMCQVHFEASVDEKLADLGPEYMESGIEFYDKIIKRNKALRHFMGSAGEKVYSSQGNENFFVRHKRIPLNIRKQYFENRLKEFLENQEKEETEVEDIKK